MSSENLPTLGRYQVIDKIAAGGMAEVFLAKAVGAMGFQRLVAVKLIHSNFTRDDEFVKMFIDEAHIAMHLHHRNIVQVLDLDKIQDTYFIAMEYVHGVNVYNLYERIASKNRWVEPSMALYIVAEVSKGLHFAHTRAGPEGRPLNIVHRDISPQNVLLSFEGEVKITDFGIATAAERLHQTAAGIVKGKYAYMAPERLQEKPIDARVDVFSVGVLLYELLVGENPFAGASPVETIENVLERKVPAPSERGARVTRELDEICLRALAKDPRHRFQTAQALADAVTEYALELTNARKDMATGDSALATLLADLFPERVNAQPPTRPAKDLHLPGLDESGGELQAHDTHPDQAESPAALLATQEERAFAVEAAPAGQTEDYDAPTLLKLTPMPKLERPDKPRLIARDESKSTDKGSVPAREPFGLETLPPELASEPAARDAGAPSSASPDLYRSGAAASEARDWGHPQSLAADERDVTAPTRLPSDTDEPGAPTMKASVVTSEDRERVSGPPSDDPFAATIPSDDLARALSPADVAPEHPSAVEHRPQPHPVRPIRAVPPRPAVILEPGSNGDARLVVPVHPGSGDIVPREGGHGPRSSGQIAIQPRRTTNLNVIAGISLLLAALMVTAAALLVLSKNSAISTVALRISSDPEGAELIVNGRDQPQRTPARIGVEARRTHYVEVRLEGYEPAKQQITPDGAVAEIAVDLKLYPLLGSVTVIPNPPGALVIVNSKDRGQGKVTVGGLPSNQPARIRVEHAGYEPYEGSFAFGPSQLNLVVPVTLVRKTK